MYRVRYDPKKCKREAMWLRNKANNEIEIPDDVFRYHKHCGCMTVLERFRLVTISKEPCKCCGQMVIRREKQLLASEHQVLCRKCKKPFTPEDSKGVQIYCKDCRRLLSKKSK